MAIIKGAKIFQKILEAKITRKKIPIMVYLLVTSRCNLRCFYCYPETQAGWQTERYKKDLSLDEIKKLIDELYFLGMRWICIIGGEPLLRPDIGLIIKHIHSKKIFCELITNGYFVKQNLDILKKIDSLVVSIDGNEEGNDLNRGKGSYRKALEGLDVALKNGIKCRIHAILTKHNRHSFRHAAKLAEERSIPVTFSLTAGGMRATLIYFNHDYYLSEEEIKKCAEEMIKLKKEGLPIKDSDLFLKFVKDLPLEYNEKISNDDPRMKEMPYKCQCGRLALNIDADGTFYPCASLFNRWGVSSKDTGVKEAWRKLNEVGCGQCGEIFGGGELSILLSMNLGAILNAAYYVINKIPKLR